MANDQYTVSDSESPTDEREGFTFRIPCDDCGSDGVNLLMKKRVLCQSCITERFKRARLRIKERWEH